MTSINQLGILKMEQNNKLLLELCADRAENTKEKFTPNDFYGNASVLKSYCHLNQDFPLNGIVPHGIYTNPNYVWPIELGARMNKVYPPNRYHDLIYRLSGKTQIVPIGSPFLYALNILKKKGVSFPHRQGTIVFVAHSTHHIDVNYDIELFIKFLQKLPKLFSPIFICVYWKDILRGKHLKYLHSGFSCISAGHMFSNKFLFQLIRLMASRKYCIATSYGTNCLYASHMGLKTYIHGIRSTSSAYLNDDKELDLVTDYKKISSNLNFCNHSNQKLIADKLLGATHYKSKEELLSEFT